MVEKDKVMGNFNGFWSSSYFDEGVENAQLFTFAKS